ncbi:30S ribosomal protein S17e [Candidatus Woesearchaeota archaeon]|jgi:small subunit ribosomal protein S17e|nr:30S ribosomal protein S17e [Candidatus Woesearchaeota archaeon]
MGRIKTKLIKRISLSIFKRHRDELKDNFEENKQLVDGFADIPSKKIRNIIAGYVTRLVKQKQE